MSTLCSICQDFLTERPQLLQPNEEHIVCALRCGHLFHRACVKEWFQQPRGTNGVVGSRAGKCPCCQAEASLDNALRIFPTGDEESDAIVRQDRDLKVLTNENQKLSTSLNEIREVLRRTESELEDEVVAHDMLKLEYGQLWSKFDNLQDQINESKDVKLAVETSCKTEMEKLETDKKDALQRIAEMENALFNQRQEFMKEIDRLTQADNENKKTIQSLRASLFCKESEDSDDTDTHNPILAIGVVKQKRKDSEDDDNLIVIESSEDEVDSEDVSSSSISEKLEGVKI